MDGGVLFLLRRIAFPVPSPNPPSLEFIKPAARNPPSHLSPTENPKPETHLPTSALRAKKMARGWISNAVAAVKFGHLQLMTPNM